ncbi:outer membrane beta-barrel protein [Paraferrimonas sedimenticola]|uniref:Outer membrane protein beta-barrel domain-containing protein n=1 Tax=Paraferrimonas sedimenticola TaxID=375674 RepID=A0AA37RYC0_9GAMM|nr:outer membrane beta-barrel protein [Paraferrimonas sedimenticola]GLP97336.1 hypothetical protein GCM10007895_26430 [Paraferrimonas sedimenticola]
MRWQFIMIGLLASSVSTSALSRDFFIAPQAGYSAGGNIDLQNTQDEVRQTLKIKETQNFGLKLGVLTKDPGAVYLLLSTQDTEFQQSGEQASPAGQKLTLNYYHIGGSLYFSDGPFKPYVSASAGATQFRPGGNVSNETRLSFGLAGGAMYQFNHYFGLFAEVQGFATVLNSDKSLFCDGENGCIWKVRGSTMLQAQANLGFQFTF